MASFSTVSLMRETPDVVRRFAEYYREAGVDEVARLPSMARAAGLARCSTSRVSCSCPATTPSGPIVAAGGPTRSRNGRPPSLWPGLRRCRSSWLLVWMPTSSSSATADPGFPRPISQLADAVRVETAEAVWGPGDYLAAPFGSTHFRLGWRSHKLWKGLGAWFTGDVARYMQYGLAGHIGGKQFLRADRTYSSIDCHSAERNGVDITRPAARSTRTLPTCTSATSTR